MTPHLRIVGLGFLGLALATGAGARAEEPDRSKVTVVTLDRGTLSGALVSAKEAGLEVSLAGRAAPDLLKRETLRELHVVAPSAPAGVQDRLRLTLTGGEVVVAQAWRPIGEGLAVYSPSFGSIEVSFDALRSLVPLPAKVSPCHDPLGAVPEGGGDHVRLVGGDEFSGTVVAATKDGLTAESERGGGRNVTWGELLVATLENAPLAPPSGEYVEIETRGGDLLRGEGIVSGDTAQGLALRLRSVPTTARVPWTEVNSVRWRGPRCVDATTLPFTSDTKPLLVPAPGSLSEKYLARERGVRTGRRPRGCPLRLRGSTYRNGWAAHSGSEIRVALEGRFATFETLVGIDDEALEEAHGRSVVPGDVDVRVLGDGKVLWEAKGITALEPARRVGPLNVKGVRELSLRIEVGGHDEVLDRAAWADPLLLP